MANDTIKLLCADLEKLRADIRTIPRGDIAARLAAWKALHSLQAELQSIVAGIAPITQEAVNG